MCATRRTPGLRSQTSDLYRLLETAAGRAAKTFGEVIEAMAVPIEKVSIEIADRFIGEEAQVFDFEGVEIHTSPDGKTEDRTVFLDADLTPRSRKKSRRPARGSSEGKTRRTSRRGTIRSLAEIMPLPITRLLDDLKISKPGDWKSIRGEHRGIRREQAQLYVDDVRFPFAELLLAQKKDPPASQSVKHDDTTIEEQLSKREMPLKVAKIGQSDSPGTAAIDAMVHVYKATTTYRRRNPARITASVKVGRYGEPITR
ncbi:MAG: hypothetical protein HN337_05905, partial [Deltaproteobacteria bacterium]|nr:hypothetical protein [Deltaproteobacteria bacterium]